MDKDVKPENRVESVGLCIFFLCFSPEGSYTDDPNQEHRAPPQPDQHEFDDEFEDDDPLPAIGHCKALYSFDGTQLLKIEQKAPAPCTHTNINIMTMTVFLCVCVFTYLCSFACSQALTRAH